MEGEGRKRKWGTEKRIFQEKWCDSYFFTDVNGKAICLICQESVAVMKDYNLKRHFDTKHSAAHSKYTGIARKDKARELKAKLCAQQGTLTRTSLAQESVTRVSYGIAQLIAKRGKAFATGEFVKECLTLAADALCPAKKDLFKSISLSRNTITRRVEDLSRDISEQVHNKAQDFCYYSVALDESTDVSDSAQLLIFLRGVNENFEVTQELASMQTLHGTTKGTDLFGCLDTVLAQYKLPWENMAGITTDGAPAMVGSRSGLATLVGEKVQECGGKVSRYHCIIHQEQLCAKSIGLKNVMQDVVKMVNSIRSKALNHRQFKTMLDEMDAQYGDVLYHQEVRWLSRGKVLKRFFDLRGEIHDFLSSKGNNVDIFSDEKWLSDLAFLVDITALLNHLNLQLQGKDNLINQLADSIRAFEFKLQLLQRHLLTGKCNCF